MKVQLRPVGAAKAIEVELQRLGGEKRVEGFSPRPRMVYTFRQADHFSEVEIEQEDGNRGRIRLHGSVSAYHFTRKDRIIQVWHGGRVYSFELTDGRARRQDHAHAGPTVDSVTAPMPGTILKIVVAIGDRFTAHQPLMIMESMKMEMTLSVPHAGVVRKIHCAEGTMVDMGMVLLTLDPSSEAAT